MPALLESGDRLLLENGNGLALESETADSVGPVYVAAGPSSVVFAAAGKGPLMNQPIVLGAENTVGFVFLNDSNQPTTPGGVTVTITGPDGTETTYTDDDTEVTLGDVLPADHRAFIVARSGGRIAASDITDGTGCVSIVHTPNAAGDWWYFCEGTSTVLGANRTYTHVLPIAG